MSQALRSAGRDFIKMTGSGNDFVFFDARTVPAGALETTERIGAICARGTGIGADGVVFLERDEEADFAIRYFNADGSLASLCGNASLCSTRLAAELGVARGERMSFRTGAGLLTARMRSGLPEIDLPAVSAVEPDAPAIAPEIGEQRIGYAVAGVPHLVILTGDVELADLERRGPPLRRHPTLPEGANVNWVSPLPEDGWAIRTFERGVEGETLACGTGAVASAVLLTVWRESDPAAGPVRLRTRSGRTLEVSLRQEGALWLPSLRGEGRIVFRGSLGEI